MTSRAERRAQQRELDAASDRFDKHGCSRCGSKPYHGCAYLLMPREVACQSCLRLNDQPKAVIAIHKQPPGKADDKAFFEAHPGAIFRIRAPFPGEIEELHARNFALAAMMGGTFQRGDGDTIVTVQKRPGVRSRFVMSLAGLPPEDREKHVAQFACGQRAALGYSTTLFEKMPAKERAIIDHASTALSMDRLLCNGRLLEGLEAQGAAMNEARDATKQ